MYSTHQRPSASDNTLIMLAVAQDVQRKQLLKRKQLLIFVLILHAYINQLLITYSIILCNNSNGAKQCESYWFVMIIEDMSHIIQSCFLDKHILPAWMALVKFKVISSGVFS